jgi:hypothetical protein
MASLSQLKKKNRFNKFYKKKRKNINGFRQKILRKRKVLLRKPKLT